MRSRRDWVVDAGLFLLASGFAVVTAGARVEAGSLPEPAWLFDVDQMVAALGCVALWWRRRWPVELAVALVAVSTFSELVAGAMVVALLTVAIHRPPRTTAAVYALSLLAALVYVLLRPEPGVPGLLLFLLGVAVQGAAVGWGLFIRHRRQLALSQRERAVAADTEARLRAEHAQHQAREQIAREMHDVLGHRLSLLSVHAGALEYRPDASAEEIARAAAVIRENAHQALQDLREVIGVLRAPVGELPQPSFADLDGLVAESSRAGMRVDLRDETGGKVPDGLGRTAYRVVQEALTNARKHAPGAEVGVRVTGEPGQGLTVQVCNKRGGLRPPRPPRPPGGFGGPEGGPPMGRDPPERAGQGLVGLTERVALAGGRLEYGPTAEGGWLLSAWLPWPP